RRGLLAVCHSHRKMESPCSSATARRLPSGDNAMAPTPLLDSLYVSSSSPEATSKMRMSLSYRPPAVNNVLPSGVKRRNLGSALSPYGVVRIALPVSKSHERMMPAPAPLSVQRSRPAEANMRPPGANTIVPNGRSSRSRRRRSLPSAALNQHSELPSAAADSSVLSSGAKKSDLPQPPCR